MDEYFCPNCGAILNYQTGFSPDCGAWTCTECGKMLMDDEVYDGDEYEGVAWFCDSCGVLLNKQEGFSDSYGSWICTECGYNNGTTEEDIINRDDGPKCPNCGASLSEQFCFGGYENDWNCTECGVQLHRDYSFDEFSIKENDEDESTKSINDDVENDISEDNIQFEEIKNTIVKKLKKFATLISKDKKIKIGISSADLIGDNVNETEKILKDAGFINVEKQAIQDIYVDNVKEDGEVEKVIIDEKIDFTKKDEFPYNSKILIIYHTKKKLTFPFSHKQVYKRNYKEVRKELREIGFTNIKTKRINDLVTGWIVKDGSIEEVSIEHLNSYKQGIVCDYDTEIIIKYHTFSKKR